jgi:branched-chain amino acid transport system ATP-binding protein
MDPQTNQPLLRLSGITAGYGKLVVLRDVSLEVAPGEILGVVGPNGVGKSTLLKVISGELAARSGSTEFAGSDITGWNVRRRVKDGLVQVPENRHLFWAMPVRENLDLGGVANRKSASSPIDEVLELFPVLQERAQQRAGRLSGGQQQMLAIGRGLMAKPRLLLLDEPTRGLAPKIVESLFGTLRRLAVAGTSILLVEQYVKVALRTADRCLVIRDGRVQLSGDSASLIEDPQRLHDAYFGESVAS